MPHITEIIYQRLRATTERCPLCHCCNGCQSGGKVSKRSSCEESLIRSSWPSPSILPFSTDKVDDDTVYRSDTLKTIGSQITYAGRNVSHHTHKLYLRTCDMCVCVYIYLYVCVYVCTCVCVCVCVCVFVCCCECGMYALESTRAIILMPYVSILVFVSVINNIRIWRY